MVDSFLVVCYGPLQGVTLIAQPLEDAPSEEAVWASWERRCLYVGDEELDLTAQRWAQWVREPYPALHASHGVRVLGRPAIEVGHTYPSAIQIDDRHDRDEAMPSKSRSRTGERLVKRGDRLWALIGAWPWALPNVRERALAEQLPPRWTIRSSSESSS